MKKALILVGSVALMAGVAYAQVSTGIGVTNTSSGLSSLITSVKTWVDQLTVLVIAGALLVFAWGLLKYILRLGEDPEGKGKQMMLWGIVAFFVMVSVWGLVSFLNTTLGVSAGGTASNLPAVKAI